jgi:hypothetical protein
LAPTLPARRQQARVAPGVEQSMLRGEKE